MAECYRVNLHMGKTFGKTLEMLRSHEKGAFYYTNYFVDAVSEQKSTVGNRNFSLVFGQVLAI